MRVDFRSRGIRKQISEWSRAGSKSALNSPAMSNGRAYANAIVMTLAAWKHTHNPHSSVPAQIHPHASRRTHRLLLAQPPPFLLLPPVAARLPLQVQDDPRRGVQNRDAVKQGDEDRERHGRGAVRAARRGGREKESPQGEDESETVPWEDQRAWRRLTRRRQTRLRRRTSARRPSGPRPACRVRKGTVISQISPEHTASPRPALTTGGRRGAAAGGRSCLSRERRARGARRCTSAAGSRDERSGTRRSCTRGSLDQISRGCGSLAPR